MSRFTGPVRVEFQTARSRWVKLLENLIWDCDYEGSAVQVIIPAGFESDGVTSPRFLWSLLPPWGHPATRAALLHDHMISVGYPRAYCDRQFYLALRAIGVGPVLATVMWLGVRAFSMAKGRK